MENETIEQVFGKGNLIQKSHFLNNFNSSFLVEKKGSEIKERLGSIFEKYQRDSVACRAEIEALKTKIGEDPTVSLEESYDWLIDGFEEKLGELPFLYLSPKPVVEEYVTDKSIEELLELKGEYDSKVIKYVEGLIEIELIRTILNSYPDNKTYKLTVKEASILGF